MGNIVSDPLDNNLIKNTELKNIIEEWAKNEYDAGLSWNKIDSNKKPIKIKNLLKKRACCTRQTAMLIALPDVNISGTAATTVKKGYKPVKIIVFNDSEFAENPDVCKFIDESQPNDDKIYSYYQTPLIGNIGANIKCKSLYESGQTNLELCKKIKFERGENYKSSAPQTAYGYFATDTKALKDNNLDQYNNYTDCNCENSILRNIDIPKVLGFSNLNSVDTLVQSNDAYCSKCATSGSCYISSMQRVNSLCINISQIQNALTDNSSNLQNIQSCSMSNTVDDGKAVADWASNYLNPTTQAVTQSVTADNSKSSSNNIKTIIIGIAILIVIIMIIVLIVRYLKKKGKKGTRNDNYNDNSNDNYNRRNNKRRASVDYDYDEPAEQVETNGDRRVPVRRNDDFDKSAPAYRNEDN
jgi:hypothetical protein